MTQKALTPARPTRQLPADNGQPHRFGRWIAPAVLAMLVLAVILTAGLQGPPAAQAQIQTTALVSNTGQTSMSTGAFLNSTTTKHAMAFTTGSNTGGYIVDSISYGFRTIADTSTAGTDLQMTLNSVAGSGEPGSSLCTLTDPATFTSFAVNTFDAPTTGTKCPILTDSTTYFVVMERLEVSGTSNISSLRTNSDAEDTGAAPGWSIADVAYERSSTAWQQQANNRAYQIEVNGRPSDVVPGNWVLKPTGLVAGNQFRLLFLTHTGHSPTSSDIADYNTYVQSQANASNAHPAIKPYSSGFTVVGSTADDDARDNTMTTGTGVPIYWLNGSKVADNYGDFYDTSWDDEANPTRRGGGVSFPTNGNVWTGSSDHGTAFIGMDGMGNHTSHALGESLITFAGLNHDPGGPLNSGSLSAPNSILPYYALSPIFTVGNTPATGAPTVTGTPRVGEQLTAATTDIEDDNGLTTPNYTYQWVRVGETDETDISGAINSTYTLKPEDADKEIKVKVTFTDDLSYAEGPLYSLPSDAVAAADVLVKNTGQNSDGTARSLTSDTAQRAQAFTTGANAAGYRLTSMGLVFDTVANTATAGSHLTITLNADTSGEPGDALCTLTDPTNFSASGRHTFNAPTTGTESCPTLAASTTYFAVIERVIVTSDIISLKVTSSSDEDNGSLAGWSISNDRHFSGNTPLGMEWNDTTSAHQIEIKGEEAVAKPQSISLTSDPNDDMRTGDDNTYAIGDTVKATVTFSAAVDITGSPQLTLLFGTAEKTASCAAATNTTTMVCSYTVVLNDTAPLGVGVKADSLALNGGTITETGTTTDADLAHAAVGLQSGHKVDAIRPTLVTTGSNAPKTSTEGSIIVLTFSEDIGTADRTKITVKSGTTTKAITSTSWTSSSVQLLLTTALTAADTAVTVELDADAVTDVPGNGIDAVSSTAVSLVATPGVTVSKTSVTVSEAAGTETYTIELDSQPTGTVSIAIASDATSNATVSPSSLSFSTSDWNSAKTVTVTGVNDSIVNATDRTATISHTVSGADYGSVTANSVSVTVTDDDTAAVELTRKQVTGFTLDSANNNPKGIWGNDETFWISQNGSPDKLFAYNRSDGNRDSSQDFNTLTGASNETPTGICSDGTTMFVADYADAKVYAYTLATKARDSAKEFTLASANAAPEGLWCDATHIWVVNDANSLSSKIFAYQRSDGSHVSSMDFDASTLSPSMTDGTINNSDPRDAWGNGTTLFTVDDEDQKVYAYKMSDQSIDSDKNIALDTNNEDPEGLWFDGRVLWVVDRGDDYVYAYDLPGAQPDNTPANGAPRARNTDAQDLWTATLTAGLSSVGIGYVTVPSPTEGSISAGTFTVEGTTYTVVNLYDPDPQLNAGALTLIINPEPPTPFTISIEGVTYSSSSASKQTTIDGYRYIWHDANLSWSASDIISIILSVGADPQQGLPLTADTTGITDDEGLTTAGFLYQWFRMDGTTETELANETSSTYTPTAADVSKNLKVRVVFNDDAGNQEYPRTSRQIGPVNALTVPDAPTMLTAEPAPDTTPQLAFDLSWTAPASDGGSAITKHQYRFKTGSNTFGAWTDIPDSAAGEDNATSYTVKSLTATNPPTTFTFEVQAINANGDSGPSNQATATVDVPDQIFAICSRSQAIQDAIMQRLGDEDSCSDVTLDHVRDLTTLHIYSRELQTLKASDLAGFISLNTLYISAANLQSIESGAFAPVNHSLRHVRFAHNDLQISDLSGLTSNLTSLSLAHNNISSLGANAFSKFTKLEQLNLEGNPITSLHADAFDGLTSLIGLYLGGYNPPYSSGTGKRRLILNADQFAENRSLQILNVSNSRIGTIPINTFNNLGSLQALVLKDNNLTSITRNTFHADLGALRSLSLGCNRLTTASFSNNWTAGVDTLRDLYLHNNNLDEINSRVFSSSNLPRLKFLSLENNPNLEIFNASVLQGHSRQLEILMFGNEVMELIFVDRPPPGWPNNVQVDFHSDVRSCGDYNASQPTFRVGDAVASESGNGADSTMTFSVNLQYGDADPHNVEYHTQDGTATAGSDYTAASGTLTFGPDEYSKTVLVTVRDDNFEDSGETFRLVLTNPTGGAQIHGNAGSATGTILNHDQPGVEATFPQTSQTSTLHTGEEDHPQVIVAFSQEVATFGALTPSVQVTGGTLTSVTTQDLDGIENAWLLVLSPSGVSNISLEIIPNQACDNGGICTTEGIPVTAVPAALTIPGPDQATTTNPLTASFANVPTDHDGSTSFTFTLSFSEKVEAGYTRIRDHAFTITGGDIDNATRVTQGSNQSWTVHVDPDDNGAISITLPQTTDCDATGAICTDDDRKLSHPTSATVAGPPAISVSDASVQEADGAVLTFTATLSHASSSTITVGYATSDGTATAGSDYTAASGTLTFNPGDTSQTVSVTVLTDSDDEGQETLTLTLSNPSQATLDDASGIGAIENGESTVPQDDPPAEDPVVLVTASFANMPADHNGSNFTFQLNFSENVDAGYARIQDHAFTVTGATIDSASRITQGSNQGWNVEVNPTGNGAVSITLPETTDCSDSGAICTDDSRKLSHPTSATVAGSPAISVSDATVQEAEGAVLVFTVTLSHASSRTVTVGYATSDGTAQAGSDYTAASGTLTFNAGDTSQTIQVTVLTDSEDEGQEALTLTLSNPSQATLDDATGAGAIENGESSSGTQEDPPVVLLTGSFSNMPATHNGSAFTFDLSFSENVKAGYARIRDHAFTISGASAIASAVRKTQGSNQNWTITVQPSGNDAITITLPPTTDCDADGAICTYDGRKLSNRLVFTVSGPGQ